MPESPTPVLSVAALFADRDAQRRRDREAEEHLKRKAQEELAEFKKRLDTFQLTDERIESALGRLKRAFEKGETELMLSSFPCEFCTDRGRAINNQDAPPINKPDKGQAAATAIEPEWLDTVPAGVRLVYDYWKANLAPGGFRFSIRIISYKNDMPSEVGLFLSWPKSAMEAAG